MFLVLKVVQRLMESFWLVLHPFERKKTIALASIDSPPQNLTVGLVVFICTLTDHLQTVVFLSDPDVLVFE